MRISDWSSDVCSSDLPLGELRITGLDDPRSLGGGDRRNRLARQRRFGRERRIFGHLVAIAQRVGGLHQAKDVERHSLVRSEEHTSELQSLMRISYAVFCLKQKKKNKYKQRPSQHRHE